MTEPLDEQYLTWLYSQVASVKATNPSRTYWNLIRQLYKREFIWFIPNDDNRVEDGRDLRYEFRDTFNYEHLDDAWMGLGCSVLEMLMGLSVRLSFEADDTPKNWFWHLLNNVGLDRCTDESYRNAKTEEYVDDVIDQVVWRTYARNGKGGLFPLEKTRKDQRDMELWYQLSLYLEERA